MCQFCHQHGEGRKWYLEAANYSDDLLADTRRRKFIERFDTLDDAARAVGGGRRSIERLGRLPRFVGFMVKRLLTEKMKRVHYGQVVPIEEIEQIFGFTNSIVRVACVCRKETTNKEQRYCYGVSLEPHGMFIETVKHLFSNSPGAPDMAGFETLTPEEAMTSFRNHEKEGLCHTVWTFHTPFIGGICNCDRSDCLALRSTISHALPAMFRAEFVARVDPGLCNGCRECMRFCQFGALAFSAANRKSIIDQQFCYGCGLCRVACAKQAITLVDRSSSPVANVW